METNIKEFKTLIATYRAITKKDLKKAKKEFKKSKGKRYPSQCLSTITGFGTVENCTLCKPLIKDYYILDCHKCVYHIKSFERCTASITFNKIRHARNLKELLKAIKKRAEYMESLIKV